MQGSPGGSEVQSKSGASRSVLDCIEVLAFPALKLIEGGICIVLSQHSGVQPSQRLSLSGGKGGGQSNVYWDTGGQLH